MQVVLHVVKHSLRAAHAGASLFCFTCRYRHTSYHKQTKNQWARDDPAFVIATCGLLTVASAAYCIACASAGSHVLNLLHLNMVDQNVQCAFTARSL